jgi:O-antigen/teichoic acid export membrane protein
MSKGLDHSYRHILKYTGIFGSVQGINILIGLVRSKLVAVLLGPEGMGLISLLNSSIKLVSDSTNLGLGISAVKRLSLLYEKEDEQQLLGEMAVVRSWGVLTALLGMAVMVVLSPFLNAMSFSWGDHTLHYVLLSPVIGMTAVVGAELAILKATRHLKQLATLSVYNVLGALFLSVPLFYVWGASAIVPSMVLVVFLQLLLTCWYSWRLFPYRVSFSRDTLSKGRVMVVLGMAFVVAGILGSGADFVIRSYLNSATSLSELGFYNTATMITMTFGGMLFTALEADYYPCLSAAQDNVRESNLIVNHQIEVSLLLVAPIVTFSVVSLPVVVPLLFSSAFNSVVPLTQVLIFALFARAFTLPVQYISLAKGASLSYLQLEAFYDITVVAGVVLGHHFYGLMGAMIAQLAVCVVESAVSCIYMHYKFGFLLAGRLMKTLAKVLPFGLAAYVCTFCLDGWSYWLVGMTLVALNCQLSYRTMKYRIHRDRSIPA